jgi:hypothetical protein
MQWSDWSSDVCSSDLFNLGEEKGAQNTVLCCDHYFAGNPQVVNAIALTTSEKVSGREYFVPLLIRSVDPLPGKSFWAALTNRRGNSGGGRPCHFFPEREFRRRVLCRIGAVA